MQRVPPGGFHHFYGAERRLHDGDACRVAHPAGEARRDGGDQVGAGDEERQRQPAARGRHRARRDAKPGKRVRDHVGLRQPGRRMRRRGQAFSGEAAVTQPRVGGIGHVHDPVPQEHLRVAVRAEARGGDEHVVPEQAVAGFLEPGGDRPRVEPHPGCQFVHAAQQPAQREDRLRRDRDREAAAAGGRVEPGGHGERPLHLAERVLHRGQQGRGHRGEPVLASRPDEELIAEVLPQPGEGTAHRRLAEAEPLPRPRDVPVLKQGAKYSQKVEVNANRAGHGCPFPPNTQIETHCHLNHSSFHVRFDLTLTGVTKWRSAVST